MKHYFFRNFIRIFLIALILLTVQAGSLLIQYTFSQNNWKKDVYKGFVATVHNWIESRSPKFLGIKDIDYYMSTINDNRVSGIIVTDAKNNIFFMVGRTPQGNLLSGKSAQTITTKLNNTLFEIQNDGFYVSETKEKVNLSIPSGIAANDIVGSVTVTSGEDVITAYLLSFSPRTYIYSKDIINSCLTSVLIALPVCVLLALVSAWIICKRNAKKINQIRENLNELSNGNYEIDSVVYKKEYELNQISESIQHLAESLSANNRSQKAWLASISHDLNTPVTAIKMMLEGFSDKVIPANKENLATLSSEVEQLQRRVERIIKYSTLQTESLKASEFSVKSFKEKLSSEFESLKITTETDKIFADKELLLNACRELIENAFNFGKNVELSIYNDGDSLVLQVVNSGKLPKNIENSVLLQPWTRGDNGRNSSGNGLGLAIVASIAQLHKGRVEITQITSGKVSAKIILPLAQ